MPAKSPKKDKQNLVTIRPGVTMPADVMPTLETSRSLSEIDPSDRMLNWLFFNMKLKGSDGKWIPQNVFFHSLREDTRETVDCTLLFLHKRHRFSIYDETEGTQIRCSSLDRRQGVWRETGEMLECTACQYAPIPENWKNGVPPACKLIWTFVAYDEENEEPFAFNVKSTSMTPAKRFLNRYFIGQFTKGRDLPLFVYRVRLSLTQPSGTYAVIGFEILDMHEPEAIKRYGAMAETLIGSEKIDYETEQPEERSQEAAG